MVQVDYYTYLRTDKWRNKARERLQLDGYKCKACGRSSDQVTLNVHHLTYRNIGHEPLDDLITLCKDCHKNHHLIQKLEDACEGKYAAEEQKRAEEARALYQKKVAFWEAEARDRDRLTQNAIREIEQSHLQDDYSKNGNIDMCNWSVIEKFCNEKKDEYKSKYGITIWISRQAIRDYFLCRRLELLAKCIKKGLKPETVVEKSMLNESWVNKWYSLDRINKRLEQEKLIGGYSNA